MQHKFIKIVFCLLVLACQSSWANRLDDDKPTKANPSVEAPNSNIANAKILLNKKLSNSLDKALFEATKGLIIIK